MRWLRRLRVPSWRDVDPVALGLAALVVVGGLIAGVFALGTLDPFADRYQLSAVFPDAGGVKAGNDVRVAGVAVGEVTGVHPDFEAGQVVITFEVDSGVHLGPRTRADVSAATLLGGYYLRLTGPVEEPYLEDLPDDDARRRIPLERTSMPVSLISALSDTTNQIEAIDIEAVNAVLSELADGTARNVETTPALIDALATVGSAVSSREDELRDLVDSTSVLTSTLADRDEELVALIDAATVLLDRLQERRDELSVILGSGSEAVATLTTTIEAHRADIDRLLADVHVLLGGVERNLGTINTSLAWSGPLFTLLSRTLSEEGGFNVGIEGLIGTGDQLEALIGILIPPGGG